MRFRLSATPHDDPFRIVMSLSAATSPQDPEDPKILLTASDGKQFRVKSAVAKKSDLVLDMLGNGNVVEGAEIQVPIESEVLYDCLRFCAYIRTKETRNVNETLCEEWEQSFFMARGYDMILTLTDAAIYLQIFELIHLACTTMDKLHIELSEFYGDRLDRIVSSALAQEGTEFLTSVSNNSLD